LNHFYAIRQFCAFLHETGQTKSNLGYVLNLKISFKIPNSS
jgi:hypothetical protein